MIPEWLCVYKMIGLGSLYRGRGGVVDRGREKEKQRRDDSQRECATVAREEREGGEGGIDDCRPARA